MGGQEIPTPAETREAEEMMTPLQAAMTKARYEVLSHGQDLVAAGVSEPQIEDASVKAGERVREEFEQKEGDPLRRIEKILETAAETPEERHLAQVGIEQLEDFRSRWAEMLNRERLRAKNIGLELGIRGALEQDQSLSTLKLLPRERKGSMRGFIYDYSGRVIAEQVPTNIEGVDVRVDLHRMEMRVAMDLPTLQKVVNFPSA